MRQVSSPSTGSSRTSDLKTRNRFESKNSVPCGWKYSVDAQMDCSEIPLLVVKEEQSAEKSMLNLIEDDFV